jgi:putative transcriptional regulator
MTPLRDKRTKAGLSQEEVARRADLSLNHYKVLEAGLHDPLLGTAQRLAEVFDCTVDELFRGKRGGASTRKLPRAANEG